MSDIWITGARGFIGSHLARWLAQQGHTVIGIGHGPWPAHEAAQWGVRRWLNGDINSNNLQQLRHEAGRPDAIFHLAGGSSVGSAIASPYEDFTRTVDTAAELLDWMRVEAQGAKLVAVSSAAVYGAGHVGPISEDLACQPFSPYGYHKLMMEYLCRSYAISYSIPVVIVRLFSVYGSWLKKQLLWDICSSLTLNGDELQLGGTGEELRDWTEIRDVVRVLELAMSLTANSDSMSIINAGTGHGTSVRDIASLVLGCWPSQARVRFSGKSRPGDPLSLIADNRFMRGIQFEWKVKVESGIRDYVEWYLQYIGSNA